MNTTEIKALLHQKIDQGDERLLKIIYAVVREYNEHTDVDERRSMLIEEERAKYLKGEGKSYSWDEVKKIALSKDRPSEF